MRRFLPAKILVAFFFSLISYAFAQSNQTVANGSITTVVNFAGTNCNYSWVNSDPSIGLPANGVGNIASFTAINNGNSPVTATITATPAPVYFAYIANQFSNNVSVVNTTTNTVVATVPVGAHPTGVAASADGNSVYITNNGDNTVSVINTATNTVSATIPVGAAPYGICVSPDGNRVYVANQNSGSISVISTTTNTLIATVTVGSGPYGIAISPDGTRVYCANMNDATMSEINTATNMVIATVNVGPHPYSVVVGADGTRAYVSSAYSNSITVINATNNQIVTTITARNFSNTPAMCLSPDGSRLYLVNGEIAVINTATNAIITNIPANTPYSVSISPDGKFLYATDENTNSLEIIDLNINLIVTKVPVGSNAISFGNFVKGPACQPIQFTITVNPTALPPPTVNVTSVSGNISACAGTASVYPNIQQFTVSGENLWQDVIITASANFELSFTPNSGYGNSLNLLKTASAVANTTIYIRAAPSAPVGAISGNIIVSSAGATSQTVPLSAVITALPTINQVPNQTVTNGAATTAVNFTGTGNTFTWTNDTPGIGLAASGTGNIPSFTAVNTGNSPVTATITAIPASVGYAYISNYGNRSISLINTQTNTIAGSIQVGTQPKGIALSPDGSRAYVVNEYSDNVSVINTSTNTVIAAITVDTNPEGVAVSPDGSRIYVTSSVFNNVAVINTATNTVLTKIPVGGLPYGIAVSSDGSKVYVANGYASNISVINTATNTVQSTIGVGSGPWGIAVSPDGRFIYVTNSNTNTVSVVSGATNQVLSTITVGSAPVGIAISPDGSRVIVVNDGSDNVSVINTTTNQVVATISVGSRPVGVSFNKDGSRAYVTNQFSDDVSVINIESNTVIATVGTERPTSFGNFVSGGTGCTGQPVTFTITVNAINPTITATPATGTITSCQGTASSNPNIQQFTISGNNLTANVLATAPMGFEVSLTSASGYGSNVTLSPTNSTLSSTTVFVRSVAGDAAGNISGNVLLSTTGSANQQVAVSGIVNALPVVNTVNNQFITNGAATTAINFTGTADTYNWTNDTPAIGLAASGVGNIPSFTAVSNNNTSVTATITVAPVNSTGCVGTPESFSITVNPAPISVLSAQSTLTGLTTVYGTASQGESFHVSGTNLNLTAGILITPPPGFEVSSDGVNYSATALINHTENALNIKIFIRLASTTPVGNYTGNIILSGPNAVSVNVPMPLSTVTPAPLTVTVHDATRVYGAANPAFTVTYSGFVNNENVSQLTKLPDVTTIATALSAAGQYPITAAGAVAANYSFTYMPGVLTIEPSSVVTSTLTIPNTFTPNGDGINDVWDIQGLDETALIKIFSRYGTMLYQSKGYATPWSGTYHEKKLPAGTYYYIITTKKNTQTFSGAVTIIY
jgi:gliding motility-associated-like protein